LPSEGTVTVTHWFGADGPYSIRGIVPSSAIVYCVPEFTFSNVGKRLNEKRENWGVFMNRLVAACSLALLSIPSFALAQGCIGTLAAIQILGSGVQNRVQL
jgi:hypothetical protein